MKKLIFPLLLIFLFATMAVFATEIEWNVEEQITAISSDSSFDEDQVVTNEVTIPVSRQELASYLDEKTVKSDLESEPFVIIAFITNRKGGNDTNMEEAVLSAISVNQREEFPWAESYILRRDSVKLVTMDMSREEKDIGVLLRC